MDELTIINEIFESDLTKNDLVQPVCDALEWDSFNIYMFMVEMSQRFDVEVTIEQISSVTTVGDLVRLVKLCKED